MRISLAAVEVNDRIDVDEHIGDVGEQHRLATELRGERFGAGVGAVRDQQAADAA